MNKAWPQYTRIHRTHAKRSLYRRHQWWVEPVLVMAALAAALLATVLLLTQKAYGQDCTPITDQQRARAAYIAGLIRTDLNGDGETNGKDLGIFLGAWGTDNPVADLNGDGKVDGADLGILLGAWKGVVALRHGVGDGCWWPVLPAASESDFAGYERYQVVATFGGGYIYVEVQ